MELVQEQKPAGVKGRNGEDQEGGKNEGWEEQPQRSLGGVRQVTGRPRLTSRGPAAGLLGTETGSCGPGPGC